METASRPHLRAALGAAGRLLVATLCLPVRVDAGVPVWATDLLGYASGNRAVAGVLFGGLALLWFARRCRPSALASRGLMALTAGGVALGALLQDPDAQVALLPFVPGALGRGYVALVVAIGAAGLTLRASRRRRAAVFAAIAAGTTGYLYTWPHPFGALFETTGAQPVLAGLPGGLVALALAGRVLAPPRLRDHLAGYVLAAFPVALAGLGVRAAAAHGADAQALLGLRAAMILLALILIVTFATELAAAGRAAAAPPLGERLGHALMVSALTLTLVPHVHRSAPEPWTPGEAPSWAEALYARALPRLAAAASRADIPGGRPALEGAVREALELSAASPELSGAVAALAERVERPGRNRRALERLGERINAIARQEALPLFVDVQVATRPRPAGPARAAVQVQTYRIEEARRFRVDGDERALLWLSRLDGGMQPDIRLGWTRHDAPEGVVVLDAVREHWRQDLAPALAGAGGRAAPTRTYARHAAALVDDLARALEGQVHPAELLRLLGCVREGGRLYGADSKTTCAALRRRIEPHVLDVLARKVEQHELQHVSDGTARPPPRALLSAMPGHGEREIRFAAAELSAYLAETAHSPVPRVALAHFLALGRAHPDSAEGRAGRVADAALRAVSGWSAEQLVGRPRPDVRRAAAAAWGYLFGAPLEPPVPLDAPADRKAPPSPEPEAV